MKHLFLLLFCIAASARLGAQINSGSIPAPSFFDPEREPVAIRSSDSTLQLLVSEYVLAKSVKARMGQAFQVSKVFKSKQADGSHYLIFEGRYGAAQEQVLVFGLRLIPDAQSRFYYASAVADQTCGVAGCGNCTIMNGECTGCCPKNSSSIASPLLKVSSSIDE